MSKKATRPSTVTSTKDNTPNTMKGSPKIPPKKDGDIQLFKADGSDSVKPKSSGYVTTAAERRLIEARRVGSQLKLSEAKNLELLSLAGLSLAVSTALARGQAAQIPLAELFKAENVVKCIMGTHGIYHNTADVKKDSFQSAVNSLLSGNSGGLVFQRGDNNAVNISGDAAAVVRIIYQKTSLAGCGDVFVTTPTGIQYSKEQILRLTVMLTFDAQNSSSGNILGKQREAAVKFTAESKVGQNEAVFRIKEAHEFEKKSNILAASIQAAVSSYGFTFDKEDFFNRKHVLESAIAANFAIFQGDAALLTPSNHKTEYDLVIKGLKASGVHFTFEELGAMTDILLAHLREASLNEVDVLGGFSQLAFTSAVNPTTKKLVMRVNTTFLAFYMALLSGKFECLPSAHSFDMMMSTSKNEDLLKIVFNLCSDSVTNKVTPQQLFKRLCEIFAVNQGGLVVTARCYGFDTTEEMTMHAVALENYEQVVRRRLELIATSKGNSITVALDAAEILAVNLADDAEELAAREASAKKAAEILAAKKIREEAAAKKAEQAKIAAKEEADRLLKEEQAAKAAALAVAEAKKQAEIDKALTLRENEIARREAALKAVENNDSPEHDDSWLTVKNSENDGVDYTAILAE